MTRDFNKPKRDNSRPSFRDSSPNRSRDERSPRPARPRLNRETVDRAWESGAQQQHADYRPRTGGGQNRYQGQQQRTNDRRDTSSNQHSAPYGRNNGNNRPYPNRQDNYSENRNSRNTQGSPRNFNRSSYNDNAPRSSYGQERRNGGEQRFSDRRDSFRSENHRDDENRRNSFYSDNSRGTENRQNFRDRGFRDDSRRNDRPNSFRDRPQHEESRPRWQSRPAAEQRNNTRGAERDFNRRPNTDGERFEGDYEYFERRNNSHTRDARPPRPAERPFRGSTPTQDRSRKPFESNRDERSSRRFDDHDNGVQPERHVTRLPDGRVLKGSRPAQRKNAQFWTGVSKDANNLLDTVTDEKPTEQTSSDLSDTVTDEKPTGQTSQEEPERNVVDAPVAQEVLATIDEPTEDVADQQETSSDEASSATSRKRRARSASAVTRGKKTTGSSSLKPSQRGFKWPSQS